jgi:hypothetical protein
MERARFDCWIRATHSLKSVRQDAEHSRRDAGAPHFQDSL